MIRCLEKNTSRTGIHKTSGTLLKMKVNPTCERDKWCMLLIDEISLRTGLMINEKTGSLVAYEDDGQLKEQRFVSSVLCIMVSGMFRRWKYPIGYSGQQ